MSDSEEGDEVNYLGASNQENDYASDENSNPDEDVETCEKESKLFQVNMINGNSFPGQSELFNGINTMKNIIYMNVFQNGGPEEVHDTALLGKYINLIGRIWKAVGYNQPLKVDDQKPEVQAAIKTFIGLLDKHLHEHNSPFQNEMRSQFLKLHLHCFPYCLNEKCLSMA